MGTSLCPQAAAGAVAAQLLCSAPSSRAGMCCCLLEGAVPVYPSICAPAGLWLLACLTCTDGSSDLSPWKGSWSQGRAKPAALWPFSFKNSFYLPVSTFPLVPEVAAAPEIS